MLRRIVEYLFRRTRRDADLDEEIRAHLSMERDRRLKAGESPLDAHSGAMKDFGNVTLVKEATRSAWGWTWLEDGWSDVRYGARLLVLNPLFTTVALVSLALGIGANTTIFQLLNAVRLRSLPIDRPQELVEVRIIGGNGGMGLNPGKYARITRPMWEEVRRQQKVFTGLFAWGQNEVRVGTGPERRRAKTLDVSGDFFSVLRLDPWRGRLLSLEDEAESCPGTRAVVSYAFWQSEFGGRELGSGLKLIINDRSFEVVGVTPPGFQGVAVGETFDVALPFCRPATEPRRDRFAFNVMGRLAPGRTIEQAAAHLESLSPGVMEATEIQGYGAETVARYRGFRLTAYPAHNGVSALRDDYDLALWLLFGITGLVLAIACANLANFMLARASAREREIALRIALGASRGRLLRQFTVESALLAGMGAVLGLGLAQVLGRALLASLATQFDSIHLSLEMDWRVLAFAAATAALTCLVFGTLPAVRVTRMEPEAILRGGGRGLTDGRQRFAAQRVLVVAQVALSLVLLTGALLFARSFANLATFDPGMRQKGISIAFLGMPASMPKERLESFQLRLMEQIRATPGVRSAGSTSNVPLLGSSWGHGVELGNARGGAKFTWVSPGYFETMGIRIESGRAFTDRDSGSSPRVAVVNQAFVRRFCGTTEPLGQRLRTGAEPGFPSTIYEIVGVIPDTHYSSLRDDAPASVFAPFLQYPRLGPWASVMIQADTQHATTAANLKARLAQEFPDLVMEFQDFGARIQDGLVREKMMAVLAGFFGLTAGILAAFGLYGVVSYMIARRRNEIGIRVALGAKRSQIVSMVLRDGARLLVPGLFVGAAISLVVTRGASALLFGVRPQDPLILLCAGGLLAAIAITATFVPARRAANLDPLRALRQD